MIQYTVQISMNVHGYHCKWVMQHKFYYLFGNVYESQVLQQNIFSYICRWKNNQWLGLSQEKTENTCSLWGARE